MDRGQFKTKSISGSGSIELTDPSGLHALTVNGDSITSVFSGLISGSGSLLKEGTGVLILSNSNNRYSGGTTINAGRIELGSVLALGAMTGHLTVNGTLDLKGFGPTVGALSGSGTITNSEGTKTTLTVGNGFAGTSVFTGVIRQTENSVSLIKTGSGTLRISGSNTYSGGTIVTSGTLQLAASHVLPDVGVFKLNGGTLSTGATNGYSDNLGPLQLDGTSTIALGSGAHVLQFGGITGAPIGQLNIIGWTPGLDGNGSDGQIVFNLPSVTAEQANLDFATFLSTVQFSNHALGDAMFIYTGSSSYELTPTPEPSTVLGLAALSLAFMTWLRRMRYSRDQINWIQC